MELEPGYEGINGTCLISRPLLAVNPSEADIVGWRLINESYDQETLPEAVFNLSESRALYEASFVQDVTDSQQEIIHSYDSLSLLIIMFLLFMTIITIWVFHAKRIRILHSTGLALLYGESYKCSCTTSSVRFTRDLVLFKAMQLVTNMYPYSTGSGLL